MFDIASLRIEGDATDLAKLVQGLDQLTAASQRYHGAGQKTKATTEQANAAHRSMAQEIQRLVSSTNAIASSSEAAVRAQVRQSGAVSALAVEQERAARAAEVWLRRIENMEKQLSPTSAVTVTLAQRTRDLDRALSVGAISAERHASMLVRVNEAAARGDEGLTRFSRGVAMGASSAKLTSRELMNLSFQANDVATQLLTVRSAGDVFRVLGQQSGQVAQIFQEASARGVGFRAALASIGTALGGVLVALAPVGIAIGAVVAAFGLFEREVDKSTKGTTTWGDTFQATMNVIGAAIMNSPIGDGLRWIGETFEKVMDSIVNGAMSWLDRLVGFWGAAYLAIVKNWRQLPQAIGAIVVGLANNTLITIEGMINGVIHGINRLTSVAGMDKIADVALPRLKQASNEVAAQFVKDEARISAAFKSGREDVFKKIVKETERLAAAHRKGKAAAQDHAKALKETNDAAKYAAEQYAELTRRVEAFSNGLTKSLRDRGLDEFQRTMRDVREGLADIREWEGGSISVLGEAARLNAQAFEAWARAQQNANAALAKTPADVGKASGSIKSLEDHVRDLADAFDDVSYSFGGIVRAFKTGNFGRLIDDVIRLKDGLGQLLSQGLGGVLTAGSAIATAIGGKGGRAVGGALGLAGTGVGLGAFAGTSAGAAALGTIGLGGVASSIAALAGPIGMAAGALYAAAKLFNIGGKPSNKGAGFDLVTGAISGKSRDADTENAARSAGDAIRGIQEAIKAAGIGLTDSITGLVIGTRDQTQIYTASGKTLRSAVGDSGAAVDTAMRALLESASYVSEAQEKLVKSALAAGKGFDAVQEILAKYESAQSISTNIANEILKLTDPKAFDLKSVRDEMEAQRKAAKQLAADGYLTADQLEAINAQLATLEGLKLDEVLKRYTESVVAANDNSFLGDIARSAEDMLRDAHDAFASAKRAEIEALRQSAQALRAFSRELDFGSIADRDPVSQYEAVRREFERLNALGATDPERLANLQGVSQAFIEASRAVSPTQLAFDRDLQAVRRATEASEKAATAQADVAQQALDAQTQAVGELIRLNTTALSIEQGIAALLVARNNADAAGVANDNIDVARYAALNPDLVDNFKSGGIMSGLGATLEEALRKQYSLYGRDEIAKGLRSYASGGWHPGGFRLVGEQGPEIEATGPARYYSAADTRRMLAGDEGGLAQELSRQNDLLAEQNALLRRIVSSTDQTQNELKVISGDGLYVRGRAPDDPVQTEAA